MFVVCIDCKEGQKVTRGREPLELAEAHREETGHWLWTNAGIVPGPLQFRRELQERFGPKIVSERLVGCERFG